MPASIDPANAIIVLALLDEGPRSGYDIKRAVDERLEGLVGVTAGTVYYTLKKLEARGWVRGAADRRRREYRITPPGRRGFLQLLEEVSLRPLQLFNGFEMALYFTPLLPPETLQRALGERFADLERNRARLRQLEGKYPGRWPFHLYYLKEKARELIDLHERWCQRIRRKVQEKTLARV